MSKKDQKRKGRSLFINPSFQKSFVIYSLLLGIIVSSVFYVANFYCIRLLQDIGVSNNLDSSHTFFAMVQYQREILLAAFLFSFSLTFFISLTFGLVMSHRIAGPIHRLKSYLKRVQIEEDAGPLTFRQHDYFRELAEDINQALKKTKT